MKELKNYIRSVLQETINYEDSKTIETLIGSFKASLKKEGFDLDNLNFDPRIISSLRNTGKEFGMGFNPFGDINKGNNYLIFKLCYESFLRKGDKAKKIINLLKGAKAIKDSAELHDLKILGAGLFRIALEIPQIPEVVIKIALSPSGRADNLNEINFSLGQGADSSRHKENLFNVYSHGDSGSWMIVDKVNIFSESIDSKPEIIRDLMSNQFRKTMSLFDKIGLTFLYRHSSRSREALFVEYINYMLNFKSKEFDEMNKSHFKKINKGNTVIKKLALKIKKAFGLKSNEKQSDYIEMSDENFKNRLCYFLISSLRPFNDSVEIDEDEEDTDEDKENKLKVIKQKINLAHNLVDHVSNLSSSSFRELFQDFGMLYDQAMTSGVRDIHLSNLGVKKDYEGNYKLIFTDLDSETYKLQ